MRTKLRGMLGAFLFSGEDVDKKVSVLSGGERARLALACMLLRPFNLLILDEPTNHLDMVSKDMLKSALMDYDGTLLVVSHDREFLGGLTDRTIEFRDHKLYNHIGDVNTFLAAREMDNMRAVELQKSKSEQAATVAAAAPIREVSREERKNLLRDLHHAEKAIEKLEKEIAKNHVKMADPAFFEKPDSAQLMQTFGAKEKDLEGAMQAWEAAQLACEEAGIE
jgi:ATP-binding cassette subfamily F protein 3